MSNTLPLADVKILDLMWVMAGPAGTRILADYGATIVRVESSKRIDTARTLQPFHNRKPGPDSSALYQNLNTGKLGLSLDLNNEQAREVVRDLVRWADVVTESFSTEEGAFLRGQITMEERVELGLPEEETPGAEAS